MAHCLFQCKLNVKTYEVPVGTILSLLGLQSERSLVGLALEGFFFGVSKCANVPSGTTCVPLGTRGVPEKTFLKRSHFLK